MLADAKAELEDTKAELIGVKTENSELKEALAVAENRAQDAEAEIVRLKALLSASDVEMQKN